MFQHVLTIEIIEIDIFFNTRKPSKYDFVPYVLMSNDRRNKFTYLFLKLKLNFIIT